MKTVLFVLSFLIPFYCSGQISNKMTRANADSLASIFGDLSGTEKVDTLNSIAFRIMKEFPDSSRGFVSVAIRMADSMSYQRGLADGHRILGNGYIFSDSLYLVMINFLNAARIYEQINSSVDLAWTYVGLSWMNYFTGRFRSVIDYEQKAIEVFKQTKTTGGLKYRYNLIAKAFRDLGEYDSALFYNKLAFSYADTAIDRWIYNTYGRIFLSKYYELKDTSLLEKVIGYLLKGLNSTKVSDYQTAILNANLFHPYYKYGRKETDSLAMYHLKQIIPSASKSKDAFYLIPGVWLKKGKLFKRERTEGGVR